MGNHTWDIDTFNKVYNNNNNTQYTYSSTILGTPMSTTINFNGEQLTKEDVQFLHSLKEKEEIMNNFHFGPCGDRAKISHLGIAVKNTFNGDIIIAEFHRPLFNRESCAGEEKNICIHVLCLFDPFFHTQELTAGIQI